MQAGLNDGHNAMRASRTKDGLNKSADASASTWSRRQGTIQVTLDKLVHQLRRNVFFLTDIHLLFWKVQNC